MTVYSFPVAKELLYTRYESLSICTCKIDKKNFIAQIHIFLSVHMYFFFKNSKDRDVYILFLTIFLYPYQD